MHPGGIHPHEERLPGLHLTLNKIGGRIGSFIIDSFHALLGQRTGIFDPLLSDPTKAGIDGRIIGGGGGAFEYAPWAALRENIWLVFRPVPGGSGRHERSTAAADNAPAPAKSCS